MTTTRRTAAVAMAALLTATAASARDDDPVRYVAATCANCHGTDGRTAPGADMPMLAGMPAAYFTEQINAFRNGARPATIMHQLARGYSDEQIAALAQFFARQRRD